MCVGVDPTLLNKVRDPYFLDRAAQTYKDVATSIQSYGPWAGAWVGEAGGAYNSGGRDVSHAFADGFWSVYIYTYNVCVCVCVFTQKNAFPICMIFLSNAGIWIS